MKVNLYKSNIDSYKEFLDLKESNPKIYDFLKFVVDNYQYEVDLIHDKNNGFYLSKDVDFDIDNFIENKLTIKAINNGIVSELKGVMVDKSRKNLPNSNIIELSDIELASKRLIDDKLWEHIQNYYQDEITMRDMLINFVESTYDLEDEDEIEEYADNLGYELEKIGIDAIVYNNEEITNEIMLYTYDVMVHDASFDESNADYSFISEFNHSSGIGKLFQTSDKFEDIKDLNEFNSVDNDGETMRFQVLNDLVNQFQFHYPDNGILRLLAQNNINASDLLTQERVDALSDSQKTILNQLATEIENGNDYIGTIAYQTNISVADVMMANSYRLLEDLKYNSKEINFSIYPESETLNLINMLPDNESNGFKIKGAIGGFVYSVDGATAAFQLEPELLEIPFKNAFVDFNHDSRFNYCINEICGGVDVKGNVEIGEISIKNQTINKNMFDIWVKDFKKFEMLYVDEGYEQAIKLFNEKQNDLKEEQKNQPATFKMKF